jgi:hypothetical protein
VLLSLRAFRHDPQNARSLLKKIKYLQKNPMINGY